MISVSYMRLKEMNEVVCQVRGNAYYFQHHSLLDFPPFNLYILYLPVHT